MSEQLTIKNLYNHMDETIATLNDLCRILFCCVEDVLLYIPDEAEES